MIEGRRAVAIDGEQLQLQLFLPKDGALAESRDEVQAGSGEAAGAGL